jgi:hypothetical protein
VTERKYFVLKVSVFLIVICVLAFAGSDFKRIVDATAGGKCSLFGWFNNASSLTKCFYQPRDVHASVALMWLTCFAIQDCVLLLFNANSFHKSFRQIAFGIALVNVGAMLVLAYVDYTNPTEGSHRPPTFAPMMFSIVIAFLICLIQSFVGTVNRNLDAQILWMYRAFMTSFTTPMIRFSALHSSYLKNGMCPAPFGWTCHEFNSRLRLDQYF